MSPRVVVHGHFYQPPRHDPFTEAMPVEPSAAPFHDWNARIDAESYRPNGAARLFDDTGHIVDIVNNYALLSFNVGPTLDSWLARHAPGTLAHMVGGDVAGGGAIAQPYHHVILPLADERDVRTEIRWGIAAFRHRFGREPEGLWLPETAVDEQVLAVCVEEGVGFVILSPYQAVSTPEPGVAYRWDHPRGAGSMALVFYDGPLSHDVAFGAALRSGDVLVQRAVAASPHGLVVVATDGETFGHHHKFTERAIAHAFTVDAPARGVQSGGLAAWLRDHPPTRAMRVKQSAWSCAHGVGRWKENCGCSTGGPAGASQTWRAPLRAALDVVRDHAARVFERRGGAVFDDPWAARDDYVRVLLDATQRRDFLDHHLRPGADHVLALTLLESQREALAMYTSCGWFFWDLAGIETLQVLRHAAHCLERLGQAGDEPPTAEFLRVLDDAVSNDRTEGSGAAVWKRHVTAVAPTAAQVGAAALLTLVDGRTLEEIAPAWEVLEAPAAHAANYELDPQSPVAIDGPLAICDRRTGAVHRWRASAVKAGGALIAGRLRAHDAPSWRAPNGWDAVEALDALDGEPLDLRPLPGERPEAIRQRWEQLVHAAAGNGGALDALAGALDAMVAQEGWVLPVTLPHDALQEAVHEALRSGARHAGVLALAERIRLALPSTARSSRAAARPTA